MSSCDNNASVSNHTLTNEKNSSEDYNNEQKHNLFIATTTATTTTSIVAENLARVDNKNETLSIAGNNENPSANIDLEEAATITTADPTLSKTFDNADTLTTTSTTATAFLSGCTMLPQPARVAAKCADITETSSSNQDEASLIAAAYIGENKVTTATDTVSLPVSALRDATINCKAELITKAAVCPLQPQPQGQLASDQPIDAAVSVNLQPTQAASNTTAASTLTTKAPASPATPTTPTASQLPHIASEPTFGIILRRNQQQQQQRFRNHHDVKFEGTSTNAENVTPSSAYRTGVSVSASASPSMGRKSSEASMLMSRRVSFPKSDNELVTGYLEPANPWEHACLVKSISEIAELYVMSCQKHNTKPLQTILDHLKIVELNKTLRQPVLSLKSIKLAPSDCEALEEVFKRVQYKSVDLSSCELTETAAMALFEMIEYYEAANELDISMNSDGMTHRGWTSCTYMISHSQALQVLNAQGNPISRTGAENLGHALSTSNLHTIKLEHCGLKGAPLSGLCFKLRHNRVLRELWLAHNDLDCYDAENIAKLLTVNHYLQLIDISNNNIRDEGLKKIVKALITQARELEKHAMLQRAPAIDDDDCGSIESVASSDTENSTISCNSTNGKHENEANSTNVGGLLVESDASQSEDTDDEAFESERAKKRSNESKSELMATATIGEPTETIATATVTPSVTETIVTACLTTTLPVDEIDADEEDTEDTMKSTPSATLKNSTGSAGNGSGGGQSMLDKLLSMNSTESSSSDDVGSNLSTDTLAACCSEDASLISDDIFDGGAATATSTTNTSTNSTALSKAALASTPSSTANETITSVLTTELVKERRDAPAEVSNGESSNTESNSSGNSSATSSTSNNSNSNNNNTNNNNTNSNTNSNNQHQLHVAESELHATSCVFELTAEENDCLINSPVTKALDVNKNATKLIDDFDDTHSTDSAFESASEGDISRHLPEEFSRLSASFDSSRIDEVIAASKEFAGVETATIATESTECLVTAAAASSSNLPCETITTAPLIELATQVRTTPTMPPTPTTLAAATIAAAVSPVVIRLEERCVSESSDVERNPLPPIPPKVTISEDSLYLNKIKLNSIGSPSPTPPPPSTSPGGASVGMRRNESSCAFITPSTRNRSQSSDSLCSDTSLDGSLSSDINFSTSTQINEKLAKNDTLTRQQRQYEAPAEVNNKMPCGLKALALWNNNLTKESGQYIAELLAETSSLELLNIGKNCLSNDFVSTIKDGLMRNTTLTTLGLQSAHLSAKGIETLSSILTFGGNCTLQRIDIRDNKLEVESLSTLAEVLKSNTTVTQIDIDDEPKRLSVGNDAHLDYARVLENVRSMCSRNEKTQSQLLAADKTAALASVAGRRRSGYYMGSRKISLTCHTRPIVVDNPATDASISITASAHSKLDVKRKTGTRLRSPIPSPPTVSPSSSPSRSRFKVFRVSEVSPLTSPMSVTPTTATTSSSVAIPTTSANTNSNFLHKQQSTSLPSASSLLSMATVTSSTQSIKRYSVSPRSRFQVSKIYEDPRVPLTNRPLPPITPPLMAPPTPMAKSSASALSPSQSGVHKQDTVEPDVNSHNAYTPTTVNATTVVATSRAALVTIATEISTTALSPTPNYDSTKEATNTNITNINTTNTNTININTTNTNTNTNTNTTNTSNTNATQTNTTNINTTNANTTNTTQTNTKDSDVDTSRSYKTTLSPISSASSASSSSSSSSSTSPASISSNSSIISASSSSSTASSITPLFSDNTDDSDVAHPSKDMLPTIGARCPIAVFDENDITLTKNSSNVVRSNMSDQTTESSVSAPVSGTATPQQQPMQARVRKTSWLGNPAAVDKLLTLFHNPGTIFQRSSSPDSNQTSSSSATTAQQEVNQPTAQQKSLVPTRKTSPPTWSRLGNEMMRPMTTALQQTTNTSDSSGAVLTTTAEQSISFLDAASKQICDFSKQVFRQNLAFGNETNALGAAGGMVGGMQLSSGSAANSGGPEQLDAAHIPSDVQLEIKENISPEHTITDENLHSLQKHCLAAVTAVRNSSGATMQEPLFDERRVEEAKEQQIQVLPLSSSSNSNSNTLMPTVSASNNSSVQHEEHQSAKTQSS